MKHGPTRKGRRPDFRPERVPTSDWCFMAREAEESSKERTQMTVHRTGALPGKAAQWKAIDWRKAWRYVRRLQMRIAKAVKEGTKGKVKALQWILTHSLYTKLLAVKRVTSNKGKKTPGVDGILWKGGKAKMQAAYRLQRYGYKAQPLRRIYIPKEKRQEAAVKYSNDVRQGQAGIIQTVIGSCGRDNGGP